MKKVLVTGGARSGKSTFAEGKARELGGKVMYIATAIPFDEDMRNRVDKHREARPAEWSTVEKYSEFHLLNEYREFMECDTILLECITLLVSNLLLESGLDFDKCTMEEVNRTENQILKELKELLGVVNKNKKNMVIVTNEVGMGLVPPYRLGSIYRDISGRVNQILAQWAEEVYLTVSGIPVRIK